MLGDVEPHAAWKLFRAQSEAEIPQRPLWFNVPSARRSRFPPVARLCRRSGTTEPFTPNRKRFSLFLSSSGGGLFDGRPKTQTWVWGAFVLSSEETRLRSQASSRWLQRLWHNLGREKEWGISGPKKPQSGARKQPDGASRGKDGVSEPERGRKKALHIPSPGQCPFGCANPKACTSSAEAADFWTSRAGRRTKCLHPCGLRGF